MSGMNFTESQFRELERNVQSSGGGQGSAIIPRPLSSGSRKSKTEPFAGPVDVTLKLYGHCPSKKNLWERGGTGKMFLPESVVEQISTLSMQAFHGWSAAGMRLPVEHPELTVTFYVAAKRQDRDGMYVTVLDILQKVGVLVNDNIAKNNGANFLPPCEFVDSPSDERVEIRVVKK